MYNPEITKLINVNFELSFKQTAIWKRINLSLDPKLLKEFDEIQAEMECNNETIKKLRGEN